MIKDFILQNLELILTGLSILIGFLILVFKRRPKTLDDFLFILSDCVSRLPSFICHSEHPGDGKEKKLKVLDLARSYVIKALNRSLSPREDKIFNDFISSQIEAILETPQKKGSL